MAEYSAKVIGASKDLSKKEQVMLKDVSDAIQLDEETTANGSVILDPDFWVEVAIHNEKVSPSDYKKLVIVDKTGQRYVTGSDSFMRTFTDICEDMSDCDETYQVKVYRKPSKNYKDKEFLTCSII